VAEAPLRISAKSLGALAVPDFCPRCLWIQLHAERLPFQIFPGIFSSIDSYTKKVIHHLLDAHGQAPAWLAGLGELRGYRDQADLHHSRFRFLDGASNVLLTGMPDDVLRLANGDELLVDYKTSRYTSAQDGMMPVYRTQLNGYAFIARQLGWPVNGVALVYFEPATGEEPAGDPLNHKPDGFALGFAARLVPLELDLGSIPPLLLAARRLYDLPAPPAGVDGCKDCAAVDEIAAFVT